MRSRGVVRRGRAKVAPDTMQQWSSLAFSLSPNSSGTSGFRSHFKLHEYFNALSRSFWRVAIPDWAVLIGTLGHLVETEKSSAV